MLCYKYKTRYGKIYFCCHILASLFVILIEGLKLTQMSVDKKNKERSKEYKKLIDGC